ncbi:hypothetical protein PoB_002323200 [Plakobranchus ocellatus]|uniref:Uncharacterized protein n=1 Tax=Plakobranchus ocellatus TaxID=259542 RepID=A0AAV3ZQG3_9GAST|nr:hypothetical protein PoB_002323200 [Plakobranchus ocellatus]
MRTRVKNPRLLHDGLSCHLTDSISGMTTSESCWIVSWTVSASIVAVITRNTPPIFCLTVTDVIAAKASVTCDLELFHGEEMVFVIASR